MCRKTDRRRTILIPLKADRSSSPLLPSLSNIKIMVYVKRRRIVLSIPGPPCEPVIVHPIFDILTILPFHVAPLCPSSPSVPIYTPFRSRNQPTFLIPPSLGKSRLQLIFGPPLESYPLTSPKNASQCSRNSQSKTYIPSRPGSWPRLQNA